MDSAELSAANSVPACLGSESVCVWPERDKRRRVERAERQPGSNTQGGPGEYSPRPSQGDRRRSSTKLVKHEDLRDDLREIDGHHEYDAEDYDSASSEEEIDVPLSASIHHVSLPYTHPPPIGNGNGNGSYPSLTKPLSMDYLAPGIGVINGNGHYNNHLNDSGASNHATDGRRMSFNAQGNSSMGMSGNPLQRQQTQQRSALNGYPYQQQHPSQPTAHVQQQAYHDQNANSSYTNGTQSSHSACFGHQDNQDAFQKPQLPHQQSHHVESSVRFIPGFLSAIHGDTPTPSPPNGFSQSNIGHRQSIAVQQAMHQQHNQNVSASVGSDMAVNAANHAPLGARTMSSDDHAKLQLMLPPSNVGQQSDQNGMVSSGYNISLAHVAASAAARNNSNGTGGNAIGDGQSARAGSTWTETDPLQGMQDHQQSSQFSQLPTRAGMVFNHDSSAGRDYVGINVRSSLDAGTSKIEAGLAMLIGDDVSREVGPGVGSATSAETTSSVRALKMDLGEEGHDAANELLSLNQSRIQVIPSHAHHEHHDPSGSGVAGPLGVVQKTSPGSDGDAGVENIRLSYEYLRPYGPTAISPGLGRIRLSIRGTPKHLQSANPNVNPNQLLHPNAMPSPPQHVPGAMSSSPGTGGQGVNLLRQSIHTASGLTPPSNQNSNGQQNGISPSNHLPPAPRPVVDSSSKFPRSDIRGALFDTFFDHFSSMFPFLNRQVVDRQIREGGADAGTVLLANVMCALSARFCPLPEIVALNSLPFCRGVPFADNAKQLLVPLLGMPSSSVVAALLLLSYYELGMNSEAGVWNYCGLAMRVAIDLGLHRKIAGRFSSKSNRMLFWCIFLLDRVLAVGTGRPVTFLDNHIEIGEPDTDIQEQSFRNVDSDKQSLAFAYNIKLTKLYGHIASTVNTSPFWLGCLSTGSAAPSRAASPAGDDAHAKTPHRVGAYKSSSSNAVISDDPAHRAELKDLAATEEAIVAIYENMPSSLTWSQENLMIHIARGNGDMFLHLHLWYHCIIAILYREPFIQARAAYAGLNLTEAMEIQKSAARHIQDITHLRRSENKALARARSMLTATATANFTACAKVLRQQAEVWLGVGWIAAALAKRGARLSLSEIIKTGTTDTILSEAEMRIITSCDTSDDDTIASSALDLRATLWNTLSDGLPDFSDPIINPALWGAEGLFDEGMNEMFFAGYDTAVPTPSAWQSLGL
ncbi:hypothetical protein QFC21_002137 [Naganishia friedmannii]|uniref:Uncharacterized protein n=1 Tax=Naganishia friedmannii TaxID=89922 RepID=A0ACC2W071_9TREE|nr:hypothetical protein QFC21_002137 [Naganishia friedmannii]